MAYLKRYTKTESERITYDFDFSGWLDRLQDTASTFLIGHDDGIEVVSAELLGTGVVRVLVAGGTNGQAYDVSCDLITEGNRRKSGVIQVRIRGIAVDQIMDAGGPEPSDDNIMDGGIA